MTWLIILLSLYVIYCGLLFFYQTKLMFPVEFAGRPGPNPTGGGIQVIELDTDEGKTTAWLIPAANADAESPAPLVVFFHGNAELIDQQQDLVALYHGLGVSVLLMEYRGYGHSDGTPSQSHIVADAVQIIEQALAREDIDADRLVLHGRSIGGGMATQVALRTDPLALIVESTGASVADMAWRYGVPPFLVRNPLRTADAFERLDIPILIMHGQRDEVFPVSNAHTLAAAGSDTTLLLFDASHNTLPENAEGQMYADAIKDLLIRSGAGQIPAE